MRSAIWLNIAPNEANSLLVSDTLARTSSLPLAICCAAVAAIALRERVLPRWLGIFAAVTAVALAVNAGFVYASFVPALLLFLLWTLVTSIVLLRRRPSTQPRIAYSTSPEPTASRLA